MNFGPVKTENNKKFRKKASMKFDFTKPMFFNLFLSSLLEIKETRKFRGAKNRPGSLEFPVY